MWSALGPHVLKGLLERLNEATGPLQVEAEVDANALLATTTPEQYRRYLTRLYSFLYPLERSLADTVGLATYFDPRRLRKYVLIQHDLAALGMKPLEIESVPQCMWIPWFENVHDALGWAFLIEHSTLSHPHLYRHLASSLPSEGAFASSFLKCYFGSVGEMWRSFGEGLDTAARTPADVEAIVRAAQAAYRHLRRWRATLDGKALSSPENPAAVASTSTQAAAETSGNLALAMIADES